MRKVNKPCRSIWLQDWNAATGIWEIQNFQSGGQWKLEACCQTMNTFTQKQKGTKATTSEVFMTCFRASRLHFHRTCSTCQFNRTCWNSTMSWHKAVNSFSSQCNPCHRRTWFRFNLVLSNINLPNGFSINCQADPSWNDLSAAICGHSPLQEEENESKICKHCCQNPSFTYFIINLYCDLR